MREEALTIRNSRPGCGYLPFSSEPAGANPSSVPATREPSPGNRGSRGVAVASGGCLRLCGPLEAFSFDLLDHHARRPRLIGFTNEATEETLETGLTGRSPDSRSKGETRTPVRRRRA